MNEEHGSVPPVQFKLEVDYITYECETCAHGGQFHDSACKMKAVTRTANWADVPGVQLRGGSTYEIVKALR